MSLQIQQKNILYNRTILMEDQLLSMMHLMIVHKKLMIDIQSIKTFTLIYIQMLLIILLFI